jgi:hypothetical protein
MTCQLIVIACLQSSLRTALVFRRGAITDTHDLVMQKLDKWVIDKGISSDPTEAKQAEDVQAEDAAKIRA